MLATGLLYVKRICLRGFGNGWLTTTFVSPCPRLVNRFHGSSPSTSLACPASLLGDWPMVGVVRTVCWLYFLFNLCNYGEIPCGLQVLYMQWLLAGYTLNFAQMISAKLRAALLLTSFRHVVISVVTGGGANGGNCPPQPAPWPVLRLMQIRWVFKKVGGWSKELMYVGAQSRTSVSMPRVSWLHCHPERLHRAPWTANNKLAKLYWPSRKNFGASRRTDTPPPTFKSVRRHWPQTQFHIRPTNSGFSKLALVKSKLHSTVAGQQRLIKLCCWHQWRKIFFWSFMTHEFVARFASKSDRRMMMDQV